MKKTEEKGCKDLVREHLDGRLEDLRGFWKGRESDDDKVREEAMDSFFEYGLSFDYVAPDTFRDQDGGYFRYQLSWGGPSDEFRFFTGPELKPHRIEYWYMDWFDGAPITLTGEEKAFMLDVFADFHEAGSVESAYREANKE